MHPYDDPLRLNYRGWRPPGLLTRVLAVIGSIIVLIGAVAVSLVLFAVALTAILVFGGYVWWKTRHFRRALREAAQEADRMESGGRIIEGEVIYRDDPSQPHRGDRERD
jgi:predicted membrane protein